jgi:hypothetical protein
VALKGLTEEETQALRVVLGLAIGRDKVAVEAKKFLDGKPSMLDGTALGKRLGEAAEIIHRGAQEMRHE